MIYTPLKSAPAVFGYRCFISNNEMQLPTLNVTSDAFLNYIKMYLKTVKFPTFRAISIWRIGELIYQLVQLEITVSTIYIGSPHVRNIAFINLENSKIICFNDRFVISLHVSLSKPFPSAFDSLFICCGVPHRQQLREELALIYMHS